MTNSNYPLNRKETFSVSMVIFIGLFYLLSLASAVFQTQSIPLKTLFGLTEVKFIILILFYAYGAILFFMQKKGGWIICCATLLNTLFVALQSVIAISQSSMFDALAAVIICFFLLLLMAFLFLFNKPTRIKFRVDNKSYLSAIFLYLLLLLVTFTL